MSLAAGVVGVVFGWLTLRLVMWLRPGTLSFLGELHLDSAALAFTLGLSIATTFLFGVAPALQLRARGIGDALRHGAVGVVRASSGRRARKWLVAAQMTCPLHAVQRGLLMRSVIGLQRVDVGSNLRIYCSAAFTAARKIRGGTQPRGALTATAGADFSLARYCSRHSGVSSAAVCDDVRRPVGITWSLPE